MQYGVLKNWDAVKGFGFIVTDDDIDYFVHKSDLAASLKPQQMREGLELKFDIKSDFKGDKAVNVRRA